LKIAGKQPGEKSISVYPSGLPAKNPEPAFLQASLSKSVLCKSVIGQSVTVRFVVASELDGWRSLSEVLDQVLISVGREDDSAQTGITDHAASVN
jgi:hypothetical protein